jgi:hypothetical protein
LLRAAVHGGWLKAAFGQTRTGGFVEAFEPRAFFDFGLDHFAIHPDQKAQAHGAFFFHAP